MTQSTVEERLENLLHNFQKEFHQKDVFFNEPEPLVRRGIKNRYVEEIKSEIKLAEQKAREDGFKEGFLDGQVYQNNLRRVNTTDFLGNEIKSKGL